jgi:hypothetical protein
MVVRPVPEPDESLPGYILRLADANRCSSPCLFADRDLAAAKLNGRFVSRAFAEATAEVAGLERDCLVDRAYTGLSESGRTTFYGVELANSQICAARPKVCPECLLDRPILQAAWDLTLWVVCPHHGCYLINSCQFCGSALTWDRSDVILCHQCGSPFTSADRQRADKSAVELSLCMATLVPAIRKLPASQFADLLGALDTGGLVKLIKFLGSLPRARRLARRKITPTQAYSVFKNAAAVLDTWPVGYHRLVRQWNLFDPAGFRFALMHELSDPAFQFLRDEYRACVLHDKEQRAMAISFEQLPPETREQLYISVSRASEDTGIGYATILRVIPSVEARKRKSDKQTIRLVRRSDLAELAASHEVEKWCTPSQATSNYLGPLRPRRLKALTEATLIKAKKLGSRQHFEVASLKALIAQLEAVAHSGVRKVDDPVSLSTFPTNAKICGILAIRLVLDGSLPVIEYWPHNVGLSRFAVSAKALKEISQGTANDHLTIASVARALSTDVAVVTALLQHNLLKFERASDGAVRISKEALSAFSREFCISPADVQGKNGSGKSSVPSDNCREVIVWLTSKNVIYMVTRARQAQRADPRLATTAMVN